MNDLLTTILKNITTKPDAVEVTMQPEGDVEVYTISVDPEDVGRVIGKSGKVIRAIRSLAHVSAVHTQKKVRIHLDDSNSPAPASAQTATQAADDTIVTPTPMADPAPMATPDMTEVEPSPIAPVAGEVDLTAAQPAPTAPDTADLLPEEDATK